MARKNAVTQRLKSEAQLAALASPLRVEMIGEVKTIGSCSIRELAARLDRPADGLYHHVRVLLKAGVLVQSGERKVGRRVEAFYSLAANRIGGALDPASAASRQAVVRAGSAVMRLAGREFTKAIDAEDIGALAAANKIRVMRLKTWLTDEAIAALNGHFARIERLVTRHARSKQGRPYSLTISLIPLQQKRGR
jgi:hypothetical protein